VPLKRVVSGPKRKRWSTCELRFQLLGLLVKAF
jgi:hypothetical protein